MVAVDFSPRKGGCENVARRGATLELNVNCGAVNRRSATEFCMSLGSPWTQLHGYLHGLAPRDGRGATG